MITKRGQKAQTAMELAVFGAIIIFLLGSTLRAAMVRSAQQHNILKATRMALTLSYKTGNRLKSAGRNTASVLVVEDRLAAASSKYGPIDRVPLVMQGSGTHSANLFMPVEYGDSEDLGHFDLFVNGQHFDFQVEAFKVVSLVEDPSGTCPGQCLNKPKIGAPFCSPCPEPMPDCVEITETRFCTNAPILCEPGGPCTDCSDISVETFVAGVMTESCPKLYTIIDNHPLIEEWCNGGSRPCPPACSSGPQEGCNLSPEQRFDLDHAGGANVPSGEWGRFSWQWYLVLGFNEGNSQSGGNAASNVLGDGKAIFSGKLNMAEGINLGDPGHEVSPKNLNVDVDGDLKLESIMDLQSRAGVITSVSVRDAQDGDLDFTHNDSDLGEPPGFVRDRDMILYSLVRDAGPLGGTYLQIDEGQLFGAGGGQFIRTASKKDSVDLVERVFQVSNNTGRFCPTDGSSAPTNRFGNPIRYCAASPGACFTPDNITKTCMDLSNLLIYIRTPTLDLHGRKWVTDTSRDPAIDFQKPSLTP